MNRIVVLLGGISPEREVSLDSGKAVAAALQELGYQLETLDPADYPLLPELISTIRESGADMVFNALHGGIGENGVLQAALELAGIPFTGSGSKASMLAMDKYVSKLLVREEGIPVPQCILMRYDLLADYQDPSDYQAFVDKLGLPVVVKPVDAGSSVGISLVHEINQLKPAVEEAFSFCKTVMLEEYIPGKELTVTVLDGKALPVVEIKPLKGWYDYHNKYTKGSTEYIAPAELSGDLSELLQLYAERVWRVLDCAGYARIDFRYDGKSAYFLEANTLPGMTALSLSPKAAKAAGLSFGQFVNSIILSANK